MKLALVLLIYSVLMIQEVRAETFVGPTSLEEKVLKDADFMGPTQLKNVTAESLSVMGPLTGKNIICKTLDVMGPVEVTHLKVEGDASIMGPLTAKQSYFESLSIWGDETLLEDVEVKNISIKKDKDKSQVLRLKGTSIVKGNITFESGQGIIEQGPDIKIQGEIKGAIVEKK